MKIISYSLWGHNPRYIDPLINNIEQAKTLFPDWTIYIFASDSVNPETINLLKSKGAAIVLCGESPDSRGMFWRFRAVGIPGAEVVIFRDSDSLLTERDSTTVNLWIDSPYNFYTSRDHPNHHRPVLGCSWGIKGEGLVKAREIAFYDPIYANYGDDEKYIAKVVYKPFRKDFLVYAPYVHYWGENLVPIPVARKNSHDYIGRIDSNDDVSEDRIIKEELDGKKVKKTCRVFIPYTWTWRLARTLITPFFPAGKIKEWREFDARDHRKDS